MFTWLLCRSPLAAERRSVMRHDDRTAGERESLRARAGVNVAATQIQHAALQIVRGVTGGIVGPTGGFSPPPATGASQVADPFASVAPPSVGPCDFNNTTINGGTADLLPGVDPAR